MHRFPGGSRVSPGQLWPSRWMSPLPPRVLGGGTASTWRGGAAAAPERAQRELVGIVTDPWWQTQMGWDETERLGAAESRAGLIIV